jgi:hypothetical protein
LVYFHENNSLSSLVDRIYTAEQDLLKYQDGVAIVADQLAFLMLRLKRQLRGILNSKTTNSAKQLNWRLSVIIIMLSKKLFNSR